MWDKVRNWGAKAWAWLKKYWKWLLFPIGLAIALVGYLAGRGRDGGVDTPVGPRPDDVDHAWDSGADAVDSVVEADRKRDEALAALKKQNETRLQTLSEDQQKELDQLQGKPIEEVVSWFNRL